MTLTRGPTLAALCIWLLACGKNPDAGDKAGMEPAPAAPPAKAEPPPDPSATGAAVEPSEDGSEQTPGFNAKTVSEIEGRIVVLYGVDTWALCGVIHSVGAVQVEVLGVGEPPPHLLLFVSCPADTGNRELLREGERIRATLFVGKKAWPKPAGKLPPDLPIRYAKSLAASVPNP